jgi:hypothetical protein
MVDSINALFWSIDKHSPEIIYLAWLEGLNFEIATGNHMG